MDPDEPARNNSADDLYSLAAEQYRNGITTPEIEAMLLSRGLSPQMATNVVKSLSVPASATRGFGNLNLDLWHVIRNNKSLFLIFPAVVWFPFDLFAEHVALSVGGGYLNELRTYMWVIRIPEIFVGAWLAAIVFYGIRRLAEGVSATVLEAVLGGTRQYGRFLKTTWSYGWRVGLATMLFVIPGIVLSVRFALAIPVTAFEGRSGKDAINASENHMRGKFWRLFRYLLGFVLVYVPWGFASISLMPAEESPLFNALSTIPFNMLLTMWSIWLALMYADVSGNRDLAAPVGGVNERLADGSPQRIVPRGRKRLTVTAVLGVALMIVGFAMQPPAPPFEGERILFGDDGQHEIYYDDDVERTEAWQLGHALMQIGWFEDDAPMAVRLGSDQKSYWLYFYIPEEIMSDEEVMESLRWTESFLSEMMEKPTNLVMMLDTWSGVKEIGVSSEIRPLESWEESPAGDSTAVMWAGPDTNAVPEPILETLIGNREITRWVDEWTAVCGELLPWSFAFADFNTRLLSEEAGREFGLLADGDALEALRSTLEWSPSDEFALTMFVHNLNRRESGWNLQRVEPDRWIYLFRASDSKGWPILIAGPSTRLHSIGWTGDRTAVVLGISPDGEEDCLYIWRFDVDGLIVRVERHKGPVVTSSQYEQLTRRWQIWMRKHYPDIEWASE